MTTQALHQARVFLNLEKSEEKLDSKQPGLTSRKRKRTVISMLDKVAIINRLKQGESGRQLAREFGVGSSTIFDIKKNSEAILKFVNEEGGSSRKVMRRSDNERVEKVLYQWFLQKRAEGEKVTGPALCETALAFNEVLDGDPNFKASNGWLIKFKARHLITEDDIEKIPEEEEILAKIQDRLRIGKYDPDMLYCVAETSLYWKQTDVEASSKDEKITVLMCANSTGTHRLPLLLVAKGKVPKPSEMVMGHPLVFMWQKDGWVSREVFLDWYDGHFVPEVQRFQQSINKYGKVLLLVDQEPSRPSSEALKRHHSQISVFFVPDSVSNQLLPIKQDIIDRTKDLYREQLLGNILPLVNDEKATEEFWQRFGMKESGILLSEAWGAVEHDFFRDAWVKFSVGSKGSTESNDQPLIKLEQVDSPGPSSDQTKTAWLSQVGLRSEEKQFTVKAERVQTAAPSHTDALNAVKTLLAWMEKQEEVHAVQALYVRKLKELAEMKAALNGSPRPSSDGCTLVLSPVVPEGTNDQSFPQPSEQLYSIEVIPDSKTTWSEENVSNFSQVLENNPENIALSAQILNQCFKALGTEHLSNSESNVKNEVKNNSANERSAQHYLTEAMKYSKEAMQYSENAVRCNREAMKYFSKAIEKSK